MTYSLPLDVPFEESLKTVASKQLSRALRQLTPGNGPIDVHQARKCFKRFRSLLLLARPGLRKRDYERFNIGVRNVARQYASRRDNQAMLEAIAKIEAVDCEANVRAIAHVMKSALSSEPTPQDGNASDDRRALERLGAIVEDFRAAPLRIEGVQGLLSGFAAIYKKGRAQMPTALQGDDDASHEWRKSVQQHWRHLQAIANAWPEVLREHAKTARALSQTLGDEHDLTLVKAFARKHRARLGLRRDVEAFRDFCAERQTELREQAAAIGRRLFAEKPAHFAERLAVYWLSQPVLPEPAKSKLTPQAHMLSVVR
jgi:hypothetical protein